MSRARENTIAQVRALRDVRRRRTRIPKQRYPLPVEREYRAALLRVVRAAREACADIERTYPALLAGVLAERERMDAGEGRRLRELIEQARAQITAAIRPELAEQVGERIARMGASYHDLQFRRQIRAALGVDIFTPDTGLGSLIEGFAAENAALITNVGQRVIDDVAAASTRALQGGVNVRDFTNELQDIYGFGERRARVIARDQVGKLNGQINMVRQQNIGVTHYIWRTVNDQRVRDAHVSREGERFSWNEPPDDGHPGQPIQCRCTAEPDFDAILDAL